MSIKVIKLPAESEPVELYVGLAGKAGIIK